MRTIIMRVSAFVVICTIFIAQTGTVEAQTASSATTEAGATVTGSIIDIATSLPVSGASVILYRGETRVSETTTDSGGAFSFKNESPAVYHVEVRGNGYISGRSQDIFLTPGSSRANVALTLQRSSESSSGLREIARVGASTSSNQTLQTSSTITQEISPERLAREDYARAADALSTLPGVNVRGLDSAIGDDIYVDIRGFKTSETQTLLDGHPIGAFGVFGSQGGSNQNNSYNYQASPFFSLRNIEVTYGAGALATLYGSDGIGGTVDLQTLNPTKKNQLNFQQGIGNEGKLTTSLALSGSTTNGKLGYVLSHGVQGTYGAFKPGNVIQPGLLGQDQSSAGIAAVPALYPVSGNYLLRQDLLKVRYDLSPATRFQYTQFLSGSYDDKTGNGDNDSIPFQTRLSQVQAGDFTTFTSPSGAVFSCPTGQVAANFNSGPVCESQRTFAAQTSGPQGGGPGRYQTILNQDYHGRLTSSYENNSFTVDSFIDRFQTNTARSANIDSNFNSTYGFLAADDIAFGENSFGFGYSNLNQRLDGDSNNAANPVLVGKPRLGQDLSSIFVRGGYHVSPQLTLNGNLYLKNSTVDPGTNRLDPRLTATIKVTKNDVVRLSGARTQGEPSILLSQGAPSFGSPGSTTYVCGGTGVGSAPGSGLKPEDSKELDVTYGHRFSGDSQIQIALYNANVANELLSGTVPLLGVPGLANNPNFLGNFGGYASRLASQCGIPISAVTAANFTVNSTANIARLRNQGVEISGRYRANPRLYFDYSFDEQQAQTFGLPISFLKSNLNYLDGGQVPGTPRQKASLAFDVNDGKGLEIRVDGFYTAVNNYLSGPPYSQFNSSLSKDFKHGTSLNFGIQNMFNSNAGGYGQFGNQVFQAENQFGSDTNSVQQFNSGVGGSERFFLPPRAFQVLFSQQI